MSQTTMEGVGTPFGKRIQMGDALREMIKRRGESHGIRFDEDRKNSAPQNLEIEVFLSIWKNMAVGTVVLPCTSRGSRCRSAAHQIVSKKDSGSDMSTWQHQGIQSLTITFICMDHLYCTESAKYRSVSTVIRNRQLPPAAQSAHSLGLQWMQIQMNGHACAEK